MQSNMHRYISWARISITAGMCLPLGAVSVASCRGEDAPADTECRLRAGCKPAISPDGKSIILSLEGDDNHDLYELQLEDPKPKLLSKSSTSRSCPAISLSGELLAYAVRGAGASSHIEILDRKTGVRRLLTDDE